MANSSYPKFIVVLFIALTFSQGAVAQISDTASVEAVDSIASDSARYEKWGFISPIIRYFDNTNKEHKDKAFDISFIGGPHYSNEKKFGLGLLAAGVYSTDRSDSLTPPSNVSVYADVSTSGFYSVGVRGSSRFNGDKYRLNFKGEFESMPDKFWGIGYENDANNDTQTKYKRLMAEAEIDAQIRLLPDFYVGPMVEFAYVKGSDYEPAMLFLWRGEEMRTFSYAVGFQVSYDTRDNLTAPHRGTCLSLAQRYYGKWMGNTYPFSSTELTAAWYTPTWKDCTLAMQYHTLITYGDTPWGMLAYMGGSYTMRGYYEGRYRDKGEMDFTAELRQRVYRRIGVVVWGGVGSVFPRLSCMSFKQLLPSYGVGVRWEFKKNVNVRFDVGFGKCEKGFVFNINEAF